MFHETTLIFTEPLLRRAVFAFWCRSVGVGFPLALLVVALSLGVLLTQGDTSWVVGVLATVLFFGLLFVAALYGIHCQTTLRKFQAMGKPQAIFRAEASSFTLISDLGAVTYPWSAIKELWCFSEVWLMLFSSAQFSTLPVACLSPSMQTYILQCIGSAGGKICP
ncbi:MAG: YcxB family protein [Oscillatoriales cyanobacterium SM2_1_8]|nr:YcxB family protein [Oscillatoriales cyanobacterium SM2_1_8]